MMSNADTTISMDLQVANPADAGSAQATAATGEAPFNVLKLVHRLLRGRYLLALALAAIGSAAGAYFGYRMTQPMYQSTGLIRVKPILPKILYQSDQNGVMPMFDAFMTSQVALVESQRVVDLAMQHPDWKSLNRGLSAGQVVSFSKNLAAKHPKGTELVMVTFDDPDAEAARRAVAAVVDAYERLYGENDSESTQSRLKLLEERRNTLSAEHRRLIEQIRGSVDTAAAGSIEQMYNAKLQRVLALEAQLQEAEIALALNPTDAAAAAAGHSATQPAPAKPLSVEALALQVPEVARLIGERRGLERQILVDRKQMGENHRSVIEAKARLEAVAVQMDEVVDFYQKLFAEGAGQVATTAHGGRLSPEQLKNNEASIRRVYERVKAETEELGRRSLDIEQLRAKAEEAKTKLDETNQRIDQLNTEASVGGRISIESRGDRPLSPTKDNRKLFAAAGAMAFGGGGVALLLLFGLLDRRIRDISDVQETLHRCNRVLGVLPLLPDDDSDPEDAMVAAHSVHQIRMLLQNRLQGNRRPVIALTSASPGSGKTSLTLALGLSFAASGARTLLIDCDMIGAGLTAKMKKGSRRRTGHILRRLGLINTEQLIAALKESKHHGERIGETLVRQNLVSEADVAHALEVQRDAVVGLREALHGDPPNECITGAGVQGLFLMPLGSARRQHASQLSYPALRQLIDQVRNWFDVVLIDTGPILGSLEASVAVMTADEVVLAVARGEHRQLVDRAIQSVRDAGGRVAGLVLNRASVGDILSSGFSSSTSRMSGEKASATRGATTLATIEHRYLRLGPISNAVVAMTAVSESDHSPDQ